MELSVLKQSVPSGRKAQPRLSGTVAPPPQTERCPICVPAPTLLSNPEKTPLAYTLYVDIPLNIPLGKAKSMTGIFVPDNYCPLSRVDLIVYLHGWKARSHKAEYSIDAYWRQFLLREEVNKSQKNVILVAPTLGPKNEPGDLIRPAVFDKFLDQVMAALKRYGPYAGARNSLDRNLIACHSGSGWVMREIAKGSARYADSDSGMLGFRLNLLLSGQKNRQVRGVS